MISLEVLKNDEANIVSQIAQLQGALAYNRQQQEFLKKKQEEQESEELNPAAERDE